ncbi:MAG: hypothetical protein ACK56I_31230, partial [bacterium]
AELSGERLLRRVGRDGPEGVGVEPVGRRLDEGARLDRRGGRRERGADLSHDAFGLVARHRGGPARGHVERIPRARAVLVLVVVEARRGGRRNRFSLVFLGSY